jgi:hypothetical protein
MDNDLRRIKRSGHHSFHSACANTLMRYSDKKRPLPHLARVAINEVYIQSDTKEVPHGQPIPGNRCSGSHQVLSKTPKAC